MTGGLRRSFFALIALLAAPGVASAAAPTAEVQVPLADYPDGIVGTKERVVQVRFRTGADGRATQCRIARSSGEARLDAESCRIIRERARFAPAAAEQRIALRWSGRGDAESLAARGDALLVRGPTWITNMDYPRQALQREETGTVIYEVEVSPLGRPVGCRIVQSSGSKVLDDTTCALVVQRSVFIPASDGKGGAGQGVYRARFTWSIL